MSSPALCDPQVEIDVRGPRFAAAITVLVLAVSLLTVGTALATTLLVIQTIVFGLGAFVGLKAQPYGIIFRTVVQPRLAPATEFEAIAPPRFAALVGFIFTAVALVGVVANVDAVTYIAVACALAAAFLNAAFGFCLGCETFLLGKRIFSRPAHG